MRRRRPLDVWPAFADLMTVLAIVGLFTTLALTHHGKDKEKLVSQLQELEGQARELRTELDSERREQDVKEEQWSQERQGLKKQVREAVRNEKMFKAIQEAQRFVDEISRTSGLSFAADQSLQFGDDLVTFELNSVEPIWRDRGVERLQRFCEAISAHLERSLAGRDRTSFFIVQVEGHTDSIGCPGDPSCNWWISSGRAANFVALMREDRYCPGGAGLALRPIGFANSKPATPNSKPSRRIAVRVVPDYDQIIARLE